MGGLDGPPKPPMVAGGARAKPWRPSIWGQLRCRGTLDTVMDPVRTSFDRIAEQYAADFADELTRKPWDVERLQRFAAACRPGPVLDVGCGPAGHVGRFLADLGARVVGVDFSERSLAHASRL